MSYLINFTNETGKAILIEIIKRANQSINSRRLAEAKSFSGKEMVSMLTFVFPMVIQIERDVLNTYGFPSTHEALLQFEQLIRELERDDEEILRLRNQIRALYLPPIALSNPTPTSSTNDVPI